jgi:hypothetical protein
VHRSGGLVVFAGDQVPAENYNELLAGDALSRVLPAAGRAALAKLQNRSAGLSSSIVVPFRGFEQAS